MKPRLLIVSHGLMAEEIMRSAEMIVGKMENAYAVCMLANDGAEGLKTKIENLLSSLDDMPTLIMADLYGGTPCNVATQFLMNSPDMALVAGLSLGMVIEYAVSATENPNQLADELVQSSQAGTIHIQPEAFEMDDDEEIEIE